MQSFGWAVAHNAFHARVGSIPAVFAAAAVDMGRSSVTAEVVRAVWDKLLPGLLTVANTLNPKYPKQTVIAQHMRDRVRRARGLGQAAAGAADGAQALTPKDPKHI